MITVRPELCTETVLNRITSEEIFRRYCENFKAIDKKFHSTLRSDDSKPSCMIGVVGGDLLYKDFGERGAYRAIQYVARKYGVRYWDALQIINRDFKLGLGNDSSTPFKPVSQEVVKIHEQIKATKKLETILKVKYRDYTLDDLSYWGQYYWTKEMLLSVDVRPISHFWIHNRKNNFRMFIADKLAYTQDYYVHKDVFRRKIYQPFNSDMKFLGNVDDTIVQGYKRLDKTGDILIITSSLKDCGVFWRMGYNAIAPNSESSFIPVEFLNKYRKRYDRIIIWFDNDYDKPDNPGVAHAQKFSTMYDLEYYHTPDNTAKDPSDFAKKYGLGSFISYFNSIV